MDFLGVNIVTLIVDTITPRSKLGTTIKFDNVTTYEREWSNLPLHQGMIKGYCSNYTR